MAVMLSISILFFFMLIGRDNTSGVADGVRYNLEVEEGDAEDENVKHYSFYYVSDPVRKVTVTLQDDGARRFEIEESDYVYYVTGSNKKNAEVSYEYTGAYQPSESEAYAVHSKKLFKSIIVGKEPVLRLYEALTVFLIGIAGALVIGNAENLWEKFKRKKCPEGYDPVWDDFRIYRVTGGAMMCAAAVLLLVFVIF